MNFELENEENAFDVVNAIMDFAAGSTPQHFITKIIIDKNEYSLANEENMKNIKIDKIKKMMFETQDLYEVTNLSINQIENFIKLLNEIFNKNEWDLSTEKINDSIEWMKKGVEQIVNIFAPKENYLKEQEKKFSESCDKLLTYISKIKSSNDSFVKDEVEKIINLNNELDLIMSNIKNWLVKTYRLPDNKVIYTDIEKLINDIDSIMPKLENVPVLFQTGEDKETMEIVQLLTDILEKSINLFVLFKESLKIHLDKYTVKEVSFDEFFKTITAHLNQLMDAMKNNDSVMVGDLLEYEFVPNLEEIKNILIKIKDEAFEKIN